MRAAIQKCEVAGSADIRTVSEIHTRLNEAFKRGKVVRLDLDGLTETDISFVQLIESARKTSVSEGKQFALAAPAAGALRDVLERGGFLARPADRAFWLHETGGV